MGSADRRRPARRGRARIRSAGWHLVLAGTALAMSFPVLWSLLTSLKPDNEVFSAAPIAAAPTLDNYVDILTRWPLGRLVGNTFVMAAGVALGQVLLATLAAFGMSYVGARARRVILVALTIAIAVPPQALIIPQFLAVSRLGWINTQAALIVPQLGAAAMAVLILVQHVDAIPRSQISAARLEGARPREVLWHVVLPALRPAMAAVVILVFITTWNDYLWPLIVAPRPDATTVQIGLTQFQTAEGNDYGGLLAAATLTSLPIVLVYLFASRRITGAFLLSGAR